MNDDEDDDDENDKDVMDDVPEAGISAPSASTTYIGALMPVAEAAAAAD